MSSTDELLKQELGTSILNRMGRGGGGCISEGNAFETESGTVFVKFNEKSEAMQMFEGEFESLKALIATETVRVPKPIKAIRNPKGGAMLVMEYVDFCGLSKHAGKLGEKMSRLHLQNSEMKANAVKLEQSVHHQQSLSYVSQFGFSVPTCCGYIPQENNWSDSWLDFFARKIDQHVKLAEKKYGDREASEAWSTFCPSLPKLFRGLEIEPALLHGDLWGGNAGETDSEPVIFDAASFYGHCEYDLAISTMFGGFGKPYFTAYHKGIPKCEGFEDRQDLYCMFHYFNHWNHFGGGYRSSTLSLFRSLIKKYFLHKVRSGHQFQYLGQLSKFLKEHQEYPILHVRYEDLKKNPVKVVKDVATFLDLKPSDDFINQVIDACCFSNMKEADNTRELPDKLIKLSGDTKLNVYRQGRAGGWKDFLTVAQNEKLDAFIAKESTDLGFSFVYREIQ